MGSSLISQQNACVHQAVFRGSAGARRESQKKLKTVKQKGGETLFAIDEGVSQDASLTVQYGDRTFSIPPPSTGNRSMHVLSLLSQILALQNKGTDSPTTANVRLVQ